MKLTIKQEAFCVEYLKDGNGVRAYQAVYNATKMSDGAIRVEVSRLLDRPNISTMIEDARKRITKKYDITLDKIVEMLIEDRTFARAEGAPGPAITATMGLARVTGHMVEDRKNERKPLQEIDTEQLHALEEMLGQSVGVRGGAVRPPANRLTH